MKSIFHIALTSLLITKVLAISSSYVIQTEAAPVQKFCFKDGFHLECFQAKGACKKAFELATDPTQECLKEQ